MIYSCLYCRRPFLFSSVCRDCSGVFSLPLPWEYRGPVQSLIGQLKAGNISFVLGLTARVLDAHIRWNEIDIVTSIPTKSLKRTFAPPGLETVARQLARQRKKLYSPLFFKVAKRKQSERKLHDRLDGGLYLGVTKFAVHGKRILVLDDVRTTGMTFFQAQVLLMGREALSVTSLSLAEYFFDSNERREVKVLQEMLPDSANGESPSCGERAASRSTQ